MHAETCGGCSYDWRKNGVSMDSLQSAMTSFLYVGTGSIRFTQLTSLDEGYYQCLAFNDYGTAMSNVTFLQRAVLATYSGAVVEEEELTEGQSFTLEYKPTKSVPPPIFSWSITPDRFGKSQTAVVTDKRVQIDERGKHSSVSVL